jgi:CHAD domain-containing protein
MLSKNLPTALAGDVEGVHRARVASRRLRELVAALSPPEKGTGDRKAWRAAASRVRAITRALGGVRELDVAMALADEIQAGYPALEPAIDVVRASIGRERASRSARMLEELEDAELGKLERRLEKLTTVRNDGRHRGGSTGLLDRLTRRCAQFESSVAEAGALFALDRLHQVRIAGKKLRYLLELVDEFLHIPTRRVVGRLRAVQDLLGRMHDLGVLADLVRSTRGAGTDASLRSLVDLVEREIHLLHASYVASAATLSLVVEECRGRLLTRIGSRLAKEPGGAPAH